MPSLSYKLMLLSSALKPSLILGVVPDSQSYLEFVVASILTKYEKCLYYQGKVPVHSLILGVVPSVAIYILN